MKAMPRHDPVPTPNKGIANAHAWARYRRIMRWMTLFAVLCVLAVLGFLYWDGDPMPIHLVIAVSLGVFFTALVGTGLMSLLFLSSGSGHDEIAGGPFDENHTR